MFVELFGSGGTAYQATGLVLWTISGQKRALLLVTAKHGKFSSDRF